MHDSQTHTRDAATHAEPWRPELGREAGVQAGDALIVADVQRDFLPGGALGIPRGEEIIGPLNDYIDAFDAHRLPVFISRDWHPPHHCSFRERGGPWPPHCVQGTPGAQWADELHIPPDSRIISKATSPNEEAYSAFSGTTLLAQLHDLNVRRLFIGGLATDYCVRATVADARGHGFKVVVLTDAIRAINVHAEDGTRALEDMVSRGAWLFEPSRTKSIASR